MSTLSVRGTVKAGFLPLCTMVRHSTFELSSQQGIGDFVSTDEPTEHTLKLILYAGQDSHHDSMSSAFLDKDEEQRERIIPTILAWIENTSRLSLANVLRFLWLAVQRAKVVKSQPWFSKTENGCPFYKTNLGKLLIN